ncbi:MAG: transposase [Nitrospirae bacterium]|nr:transposase [Nitrospirota bacterium]
MARPLRIEYEGALYHITARGNERKNIFFSKTDYEKFLHYVAEAKKKFGIKLYAYVLMSNHYHLIVETPEANLSKTMQYINGSYTTYVNIKRRRSGHLFQGRYKAIIIDRDNYLLELSRYVHLNPVRAKIVPKPEEYLYSSYKTYISKNGNRIVNESQILEMISDEKGRSKQEYKRFVEAAIGRELDDPHKNVYGGIILGGTVFIKETLRAIKEKLLQKEEIAHSRKLKTGYGMEEIVDYITRLKNIRKEEIIKNKHKELRKLTIYFIKKNTGATNRQIGEYFEGIQASAVSKIVERISKELINNRKLRKEFDKIYRKIIDMSKMSCVEN